MALQDILQKILQEAQKKVAEVEKEFEASAQVLRDESKETEKTALSDLNSRKTKTLQKLSLETETIANREKKKILLGAKNTLIQKSLAGLLKHLSELPEKEYSEILSKMFDRLDLETGEILVSPEKAALVESIAPKGFVVKKDESVSSGFIVHSHGVEIDNTFENLIFSELRSDLESFFAQKLSLI